MKNLLIPTPDDDNVDVSKATIKRLKDEAERGQGIQIHSGKTHYIIFNGKKENIIQTTMVSMLSDKTDYCLYENGKLIVSNCSNEIKEQSELNIFVKHAEGTTNSIPKYSLHLSNGKIYKHFNPVKYEFAVCPDWVATYLKSENFYGLVLMNYDKNNNLPHVVVYFTQDAKVGYTYRVLLNNMAKLAIQIQTLKYPNVQSLKCNGNREGSENNAK